MGNGVVFCLIVLEDSRKTIFLERRREWEKKRREEGGQNMVRDNGFMLLRDYWKIYTNVSIYSYIFQ